MAAEVTYRQASLDDAAEIHALLLRLAPEIPLLVDTLEREEALYALTRNCVRSGESWVALDAANRIVGVALVEPNRHARHYAENEVLELRYAGTASEHRGGRVLRRLIAELLGRMAPVTADVSAQNRLGLVDLLKSVGFREVGIVGGDHRLQWEAGSPSARE